MDSGKIAVPDGDRSILPATARIAILRSICLFSTAKLPPFLLQATHQGDLMLLIVGKLGELVSRGQMQAGLHRVSITRDAPSRTSIVFFSTPDWDAVLPDGSQVGDHMPLQE